MAALIGKPVKIIRRCDRILAVHPSGALRTAAQQQREIVSVVTSWIRDRKTAKSISSHLFRLEAIDERLEPEQGSLC